METLILEIPNPRDKEVLLLLAGRLNCKVILPDKNLPKGTGKKKSTKAFAHLDKIAKMGTIQKSIPDPVKWQKEIRKDRKLPGR